ncbi:MAG: 5-formyltetrahydrofolate cyclo-ligase [Ruminococcus sp.]|nr:5-formyltetrahydrofolate cyclo-ligase [Ruminococcus sp.]
MPLINVREKKQALRAKYKKLRQNCPPEVKRRLDEKLTESFLSLNEYKSCETLFTFVSSPIECDTRKIIERALADGKKAAVPKCVSRFGDMRFYYINSLDDLAGGMYGILEPDESRCKPADSYENALCIVPGLCFDYRHYRVGFGKGYYDRFLEQFSGVSVGICYSKYIECEIPRGAFDRNTDILVTEKFIDRL